MNPYVHLFIVCYFYTATALYSLAWLVVLIVGRKMKWTMVISLKSIVEVVLYFFSALVTHNYHI